MAEEPSKSRKGTRAGSRPPAPVITSGILLGVLGAALTAYGVVLLALTRGTTGPEAEIEAGYGLLFGILLGVFGLLFIAPGVMVLRLSNAGRIWGIVMSVLVLIYNNPFRPAGFRPVNFVGFTASAFIIWALITYRGVFRRS